ncbi:MAG: NADH-quinone oxidoreductase subunit N [Anaerolineales bacterium]|nr:NADH-quinone oxidoreductase subunit N [Anaerolineales bacterium]
MTFNALDPRTLLAILPELVLVLAAALVMALDLAWPESRRRGLGLLTAGGFALALLAALVFSQPYSSEPLIFGGQMRHDTLAFFFRLLFMFSGLIVALISVDSAGVGRKGEYYAILIGAVIGMNFMAAAADLIMLYLAIETTSIALYLLAGFLREDDKSAEAGLKYFLFGAFTSAILLYGFSLLYGFTGHTNLYDLSAALMAGRVPTAVVLLVLLLVLVGFGFKVSVVPFHFWSPDVYEGAPTPITAFISVASKAAGFAVLMRVLLAVFPAIQGYWGPLLAVLSVFTMTLGNTLALGQRNIKRLLAYSSIAQAGYALIGLAALSESGITAVVFYLLMYTVTNLVTFAAIILASQAVGSDEIADYAGLSRRSPGLALALLVGLLSLGGMPPLAGFFAKFFIFTAAVEAGQVWLAVIGVLNAIIGLYYYLTVLKVIYLYRSERDNQGIVIPRPYALALGVCALAVVVIGTLAGPWFSFAGNAASALF